MTTGEKFGNMAQNRAHNKCHYFNCASSREIGIRMFRFPSNNDDVCRKWIENCGEYNLVNYTPTSSCLLFSIVPIYL